MPVPGGMAEVTLGKTLRLPAPIDPGVMQAWSVEIHNITPWPLNVHMPSQSGTILGAGMAQVYPSKGGPATVLVTPMGTPNPAVPPTGHYVCTNWAVSPDQISGTYPTVIAPNISGQTVQLPPGTTVELATGTTVHLAAGTTLALAPGTSVFALEGNEGSANPNGDLPIFVRLTPPAPAVHFAGTAPGGYLWQFTNDVTVQWAPGSGAWTAGMSAGGVTWTGGQLEVLPTRGVRLPGPIEATYSGPAGTGAGGGDIGFAGALRLVRNV